MKNTASKTNCTDFINYHYASANCFKLKHLFEKDFSDLEVVNHNLYIYGPNAEKTFVELTEGNKILLTFLSRTDNNLNEIIKEIKNNKEPFLFVISQSDYDSYSEINKKAVDELIKVGRAYNVGVVIYAEKDLNMNIAKQCQSIYLTDKNENCLKFGVNQKIYQGNLEDYD